MLELAFFLAESEGDSGLVSPLARWFGDWAEVGPLIAIGIPLVGAFFIWLFGSRGMNKARETATIVAETCLPGFGRKGG